MPWRKTRGTFEMNHRAGGLLPTRLRHRNIYLIARRVSKQDIQVPHSSFWDTCPAGAACVISPACHAPTQKKNQFLRLTRQTGPAQTIIGLIFARRGEWLKSRRGETAGRSNENEAICPLSARETWSSPIILGHWNLSSLKRKQLHCDRAVSYLYLSVENKLLFNKLSFVLKSLV